MIPNVVTDTGARYEHRCARRIQLCRLRQLHGVRQHFQHRYGLGVPQNASQAGWLLQDAAELGEINAALLLAEAYAHEAPVDTDDSNAEIKPPGGRNLSKALYHYRRAAAAGRLTCRYNIGVILLKHSGYRPEDMSPSICREVYAEFLTVATDLDPTIRLLFALAIRAWELADVDSALTLFMFLSEMGAEKAHRNAAQLWDKRAGLSLHGVWGETCDPAQHGIVLQELLQELSA